MSWHSRKRHWGTGDYGWHNAGGGAGGIDEYMLDFSSYANSFYLGWF